MQAGGVIRFNISFAYDTWPGVLPSRRVSLESVVMANVIEPEVRKKSIRFLCMYCIHTQPTNVEHLNRSNDFDYTKPILWKLYAEVKLFEERKTE